MDRVHQPSPPQGVPPAESDLLRCEASDGFREWIRRAGGSIAVTTYQAGQIMLIGWDGANVSLSFRRFDKAMGLAIDGGRLALATRNAITLFADAPRLAHDFLGDQPGRYDALFLPRATYYTGDLFTHDVAFGRDGVWAVATRFSCLALLDHEYSFVPRWHPPFITDLTPDDRCHLNGLALAEGVPKYVTALGRTDVSSGWRAERITGGVLLEVASGEVVAAELAMPHSPRLHDGRLWFLNSGIGELWRIDPPTGRHEVVCALPGYTRGLAFTGHFALVGLGKIREKHAFSGLPVENRHAELISGIAVVDLRTGQIAGLFRFISGCTELYDVQWLAGTTRPYLLSPANDTTRQAFTAPDFSCWMRPIAPDSANPAGPEPRPSPESVDRRYR